MIAPKSSLFIVGAMKAGTTALFDHLASYRGVAACKVKEPHYYADDLRDDFPYTPVSEAEAIAELKANPHARIHQAAITSPSIYTSLFEAPNASVTLEASPSYLASSVAPERVAKEAVDPHVVIILRNPYERLISHFEMIQSKGVDTSLKEIIECELENGLPLTHNGQAALIRFSAYSADVQRWIETLGRDRVRVYTTEQLAQDVSGLCDAILAPFGLSTSSRGPISRDVRRNTTRPVRFPRLNKIMTEYGIRRFIARSLPAGVIEVLRKVYFRDRKQQRYNDTLRLIRSVIDDDLERLIGIVPSSLTTTIQDWRRTVPS